MTRQALAIQVVLMYILISKCGVIAQGTTVQLSGSTNPREGRLEIFHDGIWGTVCDDGFTDIDARVACAELGFGYVGDVIGNRYGGGSDPIWLDQVDCFGDEQNIARCEHKAWGVHNCSHHQDVSIRCGSPVRLVGSRSPKEGRLEILYNNIWGTVCIDSFTHTNARVVCASLGYGYLGRVVINNFGAGTGKIWLDGVNCTGNERSIDECSHISWGLHDCSHILDVSVWCGMSARLNGTGNPREGRLELTSINVSGTVCNRNDRPFTDRNARVVCAMLGFGYVGEFIGYAYGPGPTGGYYVDGFNCTGNESSIEQCSDSSYNTSECTHARDVSIRCGSRVRLTGSTNSKEGRLEIFYNGSWGTVCDDEFTDISATVVCASLGFGYVGQFIGNVYRGGFGHIWLDKVKCNGSERSIDECAHGSWGDHNCNHDEDVSIRCTSSTTPTSQTTTTSTPFSSSESSTESNMTTGSCVTLSTTSTTSSTSHDIVLALLVLLAAAFIVIVGLAVFGCLTLRGMRKLKSSNNSIIHSLKQSRALPSPRGTLTFQANSAYLLPDDENYDKLAARVGPSQPNNDYCTSIP